MKNMKNMKKILALVVAALMIVASMSAMAADNTETSVTAAAAKGQGSFTITMTDAEAGHTFKAYRIFDGSVDTDGKLGDIAWATGVNTEGIASALATAGLATSIEEGGKTVTLDLSKADDVAKAMNKQQDDSDVMKKVADVFYARKGDATGTVNTKTGDNYVIENQKAGYYLVTDEYTDAAHVADGAATLSRNVLAVVGNVTAKVKNDKPTVEKKIMDPTPVDANKAGIGDHVFYQIKTKVPNWAGYDKYFFLINDDLSDGLTFDGVDNLVVKVGTTTLVKDTDYVVYLNDSGYDFRVAFKNIKGYAVGTDITVNYSATVNANAVIGGNGNPNETDLTYSNNPNDSGKGNPSENPKPTDDIPTGKSGKDITITYVAELDLTKYKDTIGAGNELDGATFTLTGTSTVIIPTTAEEFVEDASGDYYKLANGKFTLTAPHGVIKDSNGNDAVASNESYYAAEALGDNPTKYSLKTVTTYETQQKEVFMQGTSANGGKIIFKGLGAGTYTLKETVTPAGYTTATPIEFTITITVPETVTSKEQTATYGVSSVSPEGAVTLKDSSVTAGIYKTDVVDLSGTTLPSTGGMGTTILYVAGSILVLAAAILLITKRRMSSED